VLAVGTLEPRKNLARVVEATARAGVELRLVGAPGWGDAGVAGKHVTWLGRIEDEELAAAYRGARSLVFPSLYEGFGIPALEAMACGTPVVTSVGSAMEEVVGEAAILVDPLDVASIAAGIETADRQRTCSFRSAWSVPPTTRGSVLSTRLSPPTGERSHDRAARRGRRGRARQAPNRRRDVHAESAARAGLARRLLGSPDCRGQSAS
jgi:glycosyltransferase involved in cell wall biosynthesis